MYSVTAKVDFKHGCDCSTVYLYLDLLCLKVKSSFRYLMQSFKNMVEVMPKCAICMYLLLTTLS